MNLSISIPPGPSILPLLPPDSLGERDEGAGGHSHPHGVPVPPSGAHVVPRCAARKYRLAKASMGQLPVPSPSCSLLPPSGPSGKAVLVGDPCRKERWAQGTAGTVHRAVAPEQRLPPFCDPAPGPQQWKPRPWPRPLRLPPCPACPQAPPSSPLASGRSQGLRRAGRTQPGRALTCRGWPRTSTLRQAEGWGWPRVSPLWHPQALTMGSGCGLQLEAAAAWHCARQGHRRGDADTTGCRDVEQHPVLQPPRIGTTGEHSSALGWC